MALAVEQAAAVLVLVCRAYKESMPCRCEAEYAFLQHKRIIPIMVRAVLSAKTAGPCRSSTPVSRVAFLLRAANCPTAQLLRAALPAQTGLSCHCAPGLRQVERGYKPTGWLGILLGTKVRCDVL